jgi:hypothetical protein
MHSVVKLSVAFDIDLVIVIKPSIAFYILMLNDVMLIVVEQSVFMLSVIRLNFVTLSIIMLSVIMSSFALLSIIILNVTFYVVMLIVILAKISSKHCDAHL